MPESAGSGQQGQVTDTAAPVRCVRSDPHDPHEWWTGHEERPERCQGVGRHQLADDVVRDLVANYPGVIQAVNLPTPDSALIRLHRGDSTWLVSVARLEVSDA